jgi:hypothetical protein
MLTIECPECHAPARLSEGEDYSKTLEFADAEKLILGCGKCAATWTPNAADQKMIAVNVRKHIAGNLS